MTSTLDYSSNSGSSPTASARLSPLPATSLSGAVRGLNSRRIVCAALVLALLVVMSSYRWMLSIVPDQRHSDRIGTGAGSRRSTLRRPHTDQVGGDIPADDVASPHPSSPWIAPRGPLGAPTSTRHSRPSTRSDFDVSVEMSSGDVIVKRGGITRRIHPKPESMDADVVVELFQLDALAEEDAAAAAPDCPGLPSVMPFRPYYADMGAHKEPDFAYATLVTNPDYVMPAAVLMYSIAASGSQHARAILITDAVSDRDARLLSVFGQVVRVKPIAAPRAVDNPRYAEVFTKLRAWELVMFKKVVFLDTDVVVVRNVDDLFDLPEWSVTVDASERRYSTGMMVLRPSLQTFGAMMVDLAQTDLDMDLPDLIFLQDFFHRRSQRSGGHRLDLRDVDAVGVRVPVAPSSPRGGDGRRVSGDRFEPQARELETEDPEDSSEADAGSGNSGGRRSYGFARGRDVAVDGGHPLHRFDAKTSVINVMSRWYQVYSNVFNGRAGYMTRKQRALTIFDPRVRAIHYPGDTKPWRDYRKDPERQAADETPHHLRLHRAHLPAMTRRFRRYVCAPLAFESRLQMRYEPFFWWYLMYVHMKRDLALHAAAVAGHIRDGTELVALGIGSPGTGVDAVGDEMVKSSRRASEATGSESVEPVPPAPIPRLDADHHPSLFDDEFPKPIVLHDFVHRLRDKWAALRAHEAAEEAYASGGAVHSKFNLNSQNDKKKLPSDLLDAGTLRGSPDDFPVSLDANAFLAKSCALTLSQRRYQGTPANARAAAATGGWGDDQQSDAQQLLSDPVVYDLTPLDAVVLQLPQRQRVGSEGQWKVSSDEYLWSIGWCALSNFRHVRSRLCGVGDGVYAAQHALGTDGRCHLGFSRNFSLSLTAAGAAGSGDRDLLVRRSATGSPPVRKDSVGPEVSSTQVAAATRHAHHANTSSASGALSIDVDAPVVVVQSAAVLPNGAVKRMVIHVHCDAAATDEHAVSLHPYSSQGVELVVGAAAVSSMQTYILHLSSRCGCRGGCGIARMASASGLVLSGGNNTTTMSDQHAEGNRG